ncbi:MAG TPA: hypothetical protein VNW06_10295 [Cytophagaceae bacterium]|jgi:peptidyl-prolyl cis-trans isomerase D|nr:hypothetical protein [Cytophagaceae bacterium]
MKTKLTFVLLLVASIASYGQKKFDAEKQKTIELLESKRKEFQASKNDSLYIAANSDQPYRISTITRGDQAEDIEDQIFNAKIGTVVGPFDGEETFYLLKIKSMDSLNRTKAKLISFFPKGEYVKDTAKFSKLVDKYVDYIKKGKEFNKMIVNDKEVIGIRNKGVTSFWEGQTSKENYQLVFDRKSNDPYVTKGPEETQVLYVIEEKRNAPYRTKATSLVKKAK